MIPEISIVIPCYHAEKNIKQCVESIQAQTFKNWEAIFEDDKPSLEMIQIMGAYEARDPRIRYYAWWRKTSPAAARNRAVNKARGDYIAFLDADDWFEPEKLQKQIEALKDHREYQWLYTDCMFHTGETAKRFSEFYSRLPDEMIPFQTIIARRDFLKDIKKKYGCVFDESLNQIDDYDFYQRIKAYLHGYIPEVLAHYRNHGGITSSSDALKIARLQFRINIKNHNLLGAVYMAGIVSSLWVEKLKRPYCNRFDKWLERRHGIRLQIEPTTRCNQNCPGCSRGKDTPEYDLSTETLSTLIENNRAHSIILQGLGEPFMHPDFVTLCKIASWKAPVTTITNGTCIDYEALPYISSLVVSARKYAPSTRQLLVDLKPRVKILSVNFVRTPGNFNEQEPLAVMCKELGIRLHITPVQNLFSPCDAGYKEAHEYCLKERKQFGSMKLFKTKCPFLRGDAIYFDARGVRHPCCIRMRYDQAEPTKEMCNTCPD